MPCYAFKGIVPVVDRAAFVHPLASLIGDVIVGAHGYVGPGASLRGDLGRVTVEPYCSVQDCAVVHVSSGHDTLIRRGATIAHGAVIHGCEIGADVLVGINAVVLDAAVIGDESCIGALALLRSAQVVPPRSLVIGQPARIVRTLQPHEITWRNDETGAYTRLAADSLRGLREVTPLPAIEPSRPRIDGAGAPVSFRTKGHPPR